MERTSVKAGRQQGLNTQISSASTASSSNEASRRQDDSIAAQQTQDRAITILTNHQLMMRYAIANDLSVPKVRVYFEKVAAGFDPTPIITKWYPFDE
ncbi:hypothetical protein H2198_008841 [Neophaeococcomyces mojaviensis]|uniref:Uncharacterized protein n=1 Tax=Neophaeococcomyces mojaviensis TaxID=3383035 RepID=A0ACC2ZW69_9EURO|nr:hypothetical protein H2198_008841 [Knufia sp. JES_112]